MSSSALHVNVEAKGDIPPEDDKPFLTVRGTGLVSTMAMELRLALSVLPRRTCCYVI